MFRIRKETKLFLVVVTIVLSIFLGIKRSNLDKIFVQSDVKIDLSKADDIFENSFNNKKINFEFNVQDLTEINTLLTDVSTMDNANILHSELKSTYNLSVFEIPIDASDDVVSKLRSIDGISNESIQKAGIVMVNTNLKENLNNNQIAKKRIQKLINESVSPDRITSFRNQLYMVQAKIDSLGIQEEIQKHNAEFDIIMLSAVRNINGNAALRSSLSVFILTTIASLLLIIVGLIISYYIFVLMYKLMLVLGIRTSRGSSSNYNYNYNKKGYGRKVKRVYKDADGKVIKKEEKE
ncbi:MAG: hypothetical protein HOD64_01205 [Candidatus Cloacimonetes bacterium]|nr:hypothetical protein [Candidatus Cloacimonadota bacterium]